MQCRPKVPQNILGFFAHLFRDHDFYFISERGGNACQSYAGVAGRRLDYDALVLFQNALLFRILYHPVSSSVLDRAKRVVPL